MDEQPDVVQCDSTQLERKDSRPPRDLLELVDYFPGTIANQVLHPHKPRAAEKRGKPRQKLCCTKVPLHVLGDPFWGRGASELLEDEENKTS